MKKLLILISLIALASCVNKSKLEAEARHRSATSDRLNEAQKNTESLFDEMDK